MLHLPVSRLSQDTYLDPICVQPCCSPLNFTRGFRHQVVAFCDFHTWCNYSYRCRQWGRIPIHLSFILNATSSRASTGYQWHRSIWKLFIWAHCRLIHQSVFKFHCSAQSCLCLSSTRRSSPRHNFGKQMIGRSVPSFVPFWS